MAPTRKCECGRCKRCRHREYMRAYYHRPTPGSSYTSGGTTQVACAGCGATVERTVRKLGWKQGIVYCSRACKETAYKAELRRAREQAKPPRKCRHCGGFMSKRMRSDAFYCSPECNSHAHHQTRKASAKIGARQERIDRAYIIQRDGSRCHICGEVVSGRRLTIDHVVPLAKGGMHAEHNLAVACLSCNCAKGAR